MIKKSLGVAVISCLVMLISCNGNDQPEMPMKEPGKKRIDLFNEEVGQKATVNSDQLLSADSAFNNSLFVAVASEVRLLDSSFSDGRGASFFLYRAIIDSVTKGDKAKTGSRLYFIVNKKLFSAVSLSWCCLYLVPIADHWIIKAGSNIQWQWLSHAPINLIKRQEKLESRSTTTIMKNESRIFGRGERLK